MKYVYAVEFRPTMNAPWGRVSTWEMNPRLFSTFLEYFQEQVAGHHARHLYRVRRVHDVKPDYIFSGFNHKRAT